MTNENDLIRRSIIGALCALAFSLIILFGTMFASDRVLNSTLFRQSRFATTILSEDSMSLVSIMEDPGKVDVFFKFIGAVTTAYINFEMIPVNEAKTFVVIFESLDNSISIESFVYHGKKLFVTGIAPSQSTCDAFRDELEKRRYFESVSIHQYTTVDDNIRFELVCTAPESRSYLDFAQGQT